MSSKIIYGIHAVMAAFEHQPENILNLYCVEKEDNARIQKILLKAKQHDLTVQYLSDAKLENLVKSTQHQGVAIKIRAGKALSEQDLLHWLEHTDKKPLLLFLEGIQDPHNLGACLRSAQGLGVDWVVVPKVNTAPISGVVSKVACGADQTLPIVSVSNLVRFIKQIQDLGVWVIGTSGSAEQTLAECNFKRSVAIVMGTEGKGLKQLTLSSCDELVKIPMSEAMPSVNVSVATGICLYEVQRQRGFG